LNTCGGKKWCKISSINRSAKTSFLLSLGERPNIVCVGMDGNWKDAAMWKCQEIAHWWRMKVHSKSVAVFLTRGMANERLNIAMTRTHTFPCTSTPPCPKPAQHSTQPAQRYEAYREKISRGAQHMSKHIERARSHDVL